MSHTTQVKLQVPMAEDVRDALEHYAKNMGFDSAQAYIRFIAKSVADGRKVNLGEDNWGQPTDEAAERLNRWAEEAKRDLAAGKLKGFTDPGKALEYLHSLK